MYTKYVHNVSMTFEWDERKRLSNLEKHGLDFFDVITVFESPHVVVHEGYFISEGAL